MSCIKVVFGGGAVNTGRAFHDAATTKSALDTLQSAGVSTIDTAQLYGESEAILGSVDAGARFTIDTKWKGGFRAGSPTKSNIVSTARESLERLRMKQVDIFYLHAPDASVPIADTLAGVNEVYQTGAFKRFGLSNYKVDDVRKVHAHCKAHGYVLPSVYQGNYSPVARLQDTLLFPTLRELGISFYAYSPLAGGFLTKTKEQLEGPVGRFDESTPGGAQYARMYKKPAYLAALAEWNAIAEEEGCSKADLAYRWVAYNSPLGNEHGDAIIVGASSQNQLEQTLRGLKDGPLSENARKRIDHVWKTIEHEAPLDNYNG